jgi:nucleoside 2-deoxyribosyltransferase
MREGSIVFLSGKINGNPNYKEDFLQAEQFLEQMGYMVINPARIDEVAKDLSKEQIMRICYSLIDLSDSIFMIRGWNNSKGANAELSYAKSLGKKVMYQSYYDPFRKVLENERSSEDSN